MNPPAPSSSWGESPTREPATRLPEPPSTFPPERCGYDGYRSMMTWSQRPLTAVTSGLLGRCAGSRGRHELACHRPVTSMSNQTSSAGTPAACIQAWKARAASADRAGSRGGRSDPQPAMSNATASAPTRHRADAPLTSVITFPRSTPYRERSSPREPAPVILSCRRDAISDGETGAGRGEVASQRTAEELEPTRHGAGFRHLGRGTDPSRPRATTLSRHGAGSRRRSGQPSIPGRRLPAGEAHGAPSRSGHEGSAPDPCAGHGGRRRSGRQRRPRRSQ